MNFTAQLWLCFVPGCRLVPSKIAASGARALLAMTNLIGFAGKRNGSQNETLEKRRGASPRKNDRIKQKAAAHAPSVPICLPEIRPFSLLLFKINKNPPRDLFKKTASPLLTSIPVYRYTRIVGSRRQNAAFPDRQPLSPSRCRPASSFRLILSDGLRRIDAAASMRCTRRRGCPNGRFLPTPTDSLPPPTAAVQAPGALQFPPGRRPHPIPGRFSPPSAVTKCRFGAPSALPNLSRRCAARPSFARCRAHGAAHSERKRPLFRSCAPLPGDVPLLRHGRSREAPGRLFLRPLLVFSSFSAPSGGCASVFSPISPKEPLNRSAAARSGSSDPT